MATVSAMGQSKANNMIIPITAKSWINQKMKKRSEATQTLRAGCSKVDPRTNTQTDRGDYNTLRSLARCVK